MTDIREVVPDPFAVTSQQAAIGVTRESLRLALQCQADERAQVLEAIPGAYFVGDSLHAPDPVTVQLQIDNTVAAVAYGVAVSQAAITQVLLGGSGPFPVRGRV